MTPTTWCVGGKGYGEMQSGGKGQAEGLQGGVGCRLKQGPQGIAQPLTLAGGETLPPFAGRLGTDGQLHTEGLTAAGGVVDGGVDDLVDGVHQAGHVLRMAPTSLTDGAGELPMPPPPGCLPESLCIPYSPCLRQESLSSSLSRPSFSPVGRHQTSEVSSPAIVEIISLGPFKFHTGSVCSKDLAVR